jgi:hypothetical protein
MALIAQYANHPYIMAPATKIIDVEPTALATEQASA